MPREWLVIDNWSNHAVFGDHDGSKGYIPRDVVEGELGIKLLPDGGWTYFSRDDSARMHAHPEWRNEEP